MVLDLIGYGYKCFTASSDLCVNLNSWYNIGVGKKYLKKEGRDKISNLVKEVNEKE